MKNLTEGEWYVDEDPRPGMQWNRSVSNGPEDICFVCHDGTDMNLKGLADAQAIVTAVNNTYKKGIDPEAVEDMKDALMGALAQIKWDRLTFKKELDESPISCDNAIEAIEKALEKAGCEV